MTSKISIPLLAVLTLLASCNGAPISGDRASARGRSGTTELILAADVNWEALNPARGDKSPQAGTLWGDRKGTVATGFLVKFVDGFSSPPHLHNVTYRGVVIEGEIHNDDPEAANLWMPTGSFWTQPEGEVHITSARGDTNIAYIEIESGPYLVLPREQAFDNGERPVNVHAANLVWLDPADSHWVSERDGARSGWSRRHSGRESYSGWSVASSSTSTPASNRLSACAAVSQSRPSSRTW